MVLCSEKVNHKVKHNKYKQTIANSSKMLVKKFILNFSWRDYFFFRFFSFKFIRIKKFGQKLLYFYTQTSNIKFNILSKFYIIAK